MKTQSATSPARIHCTEPLVIDLGGLILHGDWTNPPAAGGAILFAHGSGSSRKSSRNQFVARVLNEAGFATLLFDLLTALEEQEDQYTAHLRFNIPMLSERLEAVTRWLEERKAPGALGYFGASTGAAAALIAAAALPGKVSAVVSRGGRPDLAGAALARVGSPTLLIVGGNDGPVIELNREAFAQLRCEKQLKIVPGASHLFEEPGTLAQAAALAAGWFEQHLPPRRTR